VEGLTIPSSRDEYYSPAGIVSRTSCCNLLAEVHDMHPTLLRAWKFSTRHFLHGWKKQVCQKLNALFLSAKFVPIDSKKVHLPKSRKSIPALSLPFPCFLLSFSMFPPLVIPTNSLHILWCCPPTQSRWPRWFLLCHDICLFPSISFLSRLPPCMMSLLSMVGV
jgi:hypothetical protein